MPSTIGSREQVVLGSQKISCCQINVLLPFCHPLPLNSILTHLPHPLSPQTLVIAKSQIL